MTKTLAYLVFASATQNKKFFKLWRKAVKKVEQDIEALNETKRAGVDPRTMEAEPPVATRRTVGPNPGPGRQVSVSIKLLSSPVTLATIS